MGRKSSPPSLANLHFEVLADINARIRRLEMLAQLRAAADQRAIERWRAAGNGPAVPERVDLCTWLLGQIAARDVELDSLRAALLALHRTIDSVPWRDPTGLRLGDAVPSVERARGLVNG